jgi:hypothetical protein
VNLVAMYLSLYCCPAEWDPGTIRKLAAVAICKLPEREARTTSFPSCCMLCAGQRQFHSGRR